MARIERKSALAKAPAIDVVEALTAPNPAAGESAPTVTEHIEDPDRPRRADRESSGTLSAGKSQPSQPQASAAADDASTPVRRGPGRPRTRRRMEAFSSKIDIELRDEVDRYIAEHETTFVDLIDEALRARIAKP